MLSILKRYSLIALALVILANTPLHADDPARKYSNKEMALIKEIQDYLNTLKTVRAKFVQVDQHDQTRHGTFVWLRPLHLKFDYFGDPKLKVVCDSDYFTQVDEDGKSSISVNSTPASIFLKQNLNLIKDAYVVRTEEQDKLLMIEVADPDNPNGPTISLVFRRDSHDKKNPIALIQWKTKDASGQITDVVLIDAVYDGPAQKNEFDVK